LGFTTPVYGFGGGFADTTGTAAGQQELADVNGDGLADLVSTPLDNADNVLNGLTGTEFHSTGMTVRFNTGDGFAAPVAYSGAATWPIHANKTTSRNLGAHFSIFIWIPFTPLYIVLN